MQIPLKPFGMIKHVDLIAGLVAKDTLAMQISSQLV